MRIIKNIPVPTGNIMVGNGYAGPIEFLSLGDYGKDINLNQHKRVDHCEVMPLTEKWVITISTQYGCSMGCKFCDVPKVGPGKNAALKDLTGQIALALSLHKNVRSKRLNIHFARMGEPSLNPFAVLDCAKWIHDNLWKRHGVVHPVVSTMMPRSAKYLILFISEWVWVKNQMFGGDAGLQLSINSTNANERREMFNGNSLTLSQIATVMSGLTPVGRKFTLNFAVAEWEIDPQVLLNYFDPEYYVIKLTPMHKTASAVSNGIKTGGDYTEYYPYEHHEAALKAAGYDVLVFIASKEEDESRITCGNAILSDGIM